MDLQKGTLVFSRPGGQPGPRQDGRSGSPRHGRGSRLANIRLSSLREKWRGERQGVVKASFNPHHRIDLEGRMQGVCDASRNLKYQLGKKRFGFCLF
jgi:hypothetical protein